MRLGFGFFMILNLASAVSRGNSAVKQVAPVEILLSETGGDIVDSSSDPTVYLAVMGAVSGRLLNIDEKYRLAPGILDRFESLPGDTVIRLHVKSGLTFSDGKSVLASDIVFALTRGFGSVRKNFFELFLGKDLGIFQTQAHSPTSLDRSRFKVNDRDGTLEIRIEEGRKLHFLNTLTSPYFSPVVAARLSDDRITWKESPAGAGDFVITERFGSQGLALSRRTDTGGGLRSIQVWTARQASRSRAEYDIVSTGMRHTELLPTHDEMLSEQPSNIKLLTFSNLHPLGRNEYFRRALALAIDRQAFLAGPIRARATGQLLPEIFWQANAVELAVPSQNLAAARKLIKLVPQEELRKPFFYSLYKIGTQLDEQQAFRIRVMNQSLEAIGIKNPQWFAVGTKALSKSDAERGVFHFSGRVCDFLDPEPMFTAFRKGTFQYEVPDDPQVRSMIDALDTLSTREQRIEQMRKISRYLTEKAFAIPLYEAYEIAYVKKGSGIRLGSQPDPLVLNFSKFERTQ